MGPFTRSYDEALLVTEAGSVGPPWYASNVELVVVGDVGSPTTTYFRNRLDLPSAVDQARVGPPWRFKRVETPALVEATLLAASYVRSHHEPLSTLDTFLETDHANPHHSEALTFSLGENAAATYVRSGPAEVLTPSVGEAKQAGFSRTGALSSSVHDQGLRTAAFARTTTETPSALDVLAPRVVAFSRAHADTVGVLDGPTWIATYQRAEQEQLWAYIMSSSGPSVTYQRAKAEANLSASDTLDHTKATARSSAETLTTTETTSEIAAYAKTNHEQVVWTGLKGSIINFARKRAEIVLATGVGRRQQNFTQISHENLVVLEVVSLPFSGSQTRQHGDTPTVAEGFAEVITYQRADAPTGVVVSDSLAVSKAVAKTHADNPTVGSNTIPIKGYFRESNEHLYQVDGGPSTNSLVAYQRSEVDTTLVIADGGFRSANQVRPHDETPGVLDGLTLQIGVQVAHHESPLAEDEVVSQTTYVRSSDESVSTSDALNAWREHHWSEAETPQVSSSLVVMATYLRQAAESLVVAVGEVKQSFWQRSQADTATQVSSAKRTWVRRNLTVSHHDGVGVTDAHQPVSIPVTISVSASYNLLASAIVVVVGLKSSSAATYRTIPTETSLIVALWSGGTKLEQQTLEPDAESDDQGWWELLFVSDGLGDLRVSVDVNGGSRTASSWVSVIDVTPQVAVPGLN